MMTVAVGIDVLARTDSSLWVSVTVALGFAPYVVFSGYAGLLADRFSRSAVLAWSFGSRAGCAAVLAVGLPLAWPVPVLVLATAVAAVLATPSYPALAAATPECVADEELPAANALVTGVENAGWIAGPGLLGLVMLAGFGPAAATGLAGAMFLFASWWAWQVRLPRPVRVDGGGTVAELLEGVRVVTHNARVRNPMTVAVLDNFLYGFLVVAVVLLGERVLGGSDAVGWLNAGLSVGALAAMLVVTPLTARGRPVVQLGVVMLGYAATVGLLGVAGLLDSLPAAVVLVVAAGAGTLLAEVIAVTLLQRAAPPAVTARVFGVYDQLNVGAIAVGSLLAGPLADRLGIEASIIVVAAACLLAAAFAVLRVGGRPRHALGPRHGPGAPHAVSMVQIMSR